ncbi:hypothetical protein DINM_006485 [Dirofilaria immitis]|nr:hypothetical protein [Dirofilaria immitis]
MHKNTFANTVGYCFHSEKHNLKYLPDLIHISIHWGLQKEALERTNQWVNKNLEIQMFYENGQENLRMTARIDQGRTEKQLEIWNEKEKELTARKKTDCTIAMWYVDRKMRQNVLCYAQPGTEIEIGNTTIEESKE